MDHGDTQPAREVLGKLIENLIEAESSLLSAQAVMLDCSLTDRSGYENIAEYISVALRAAQMALTELARAGGDRPVPLGEIARRRDVPVQFLEGLFGTLRRAGILQSQRGVKGGYSFARPPGKITVLEIVELLDGELGAEARAAGPPWAEAVEALRSVLGGVTVAELAEREADAAAAPMYYI